MVVAAFGSEVEAAVSIGVVEKAKGQSRRLAEGDVERNMLVERIRCVRVIAHGVHIAHAKAAIGPIHRAGLFTEAEIAFVRITFEIVPNALAPPAEVIGLGRSVPRNGDPFSGVVHHLP